MLQLKASPAIPVRAAPALAYELFVPVRRPLDARRGAPLIVALHGSTQTAASFAAGSELNDAAERAGAYVLYPEQSPMANPLRAWNWFRPEHQTRSDGEPAAILELVERVCTQYPIDRAHVFVVGLSAGGAMAAILAEQAPDVFAGAGIVAGVPLHAAHDAPSAYGAMRGELSPEELVPRATGREEAAARARQRVTIWTGTDDKVVLPSNARVLARQFRLLLGVGDHRRSVERRGAETTTRWRDHQGIVRVELHRIADMGHAWSGGSLRGSYTFPSGPPASREIVRFFLPALEDAQLRPAAAHQTRSRLR